MKMYVSLFAIVIAAVHLVGCKHDHCGGKSGKRVTTSGGDSNQAGNTNKPLTKEQEKRRAKVFAKVVVAEYISRSQEQGMLSEDKIKEIVKNAGGDARDVAAVVTGMKELREFKVDLLDTDTESLTIGEVRKSKMLRDAVQEEWARVQNELDNKHPGTIG